jgi:hypothetical protein
MKEGMTQDRVMPQFVITVPARPSPALGPSDVTTTSDVITGLVPVIPTRKSSAPHSIVMAGTTPAMTGRVSSPTAAGGAEVSDPGAEAAREGGAAIR